MNLEGEIKVALKKQVSLQMLREIVCQYKQNGGTQHAAYMTLEKIRAEQMEEPDEDRIWEHCKTLCRNQVKYSGGGAVQKIHKRLV